MMADSNKIITNKDKDLDPFRIKLSKWFGSFECPWNKWKTPDPFTLLHWKFLEKDHSNIPEKEDLDNILPVLEVNKTKISNPPQDKVQVTWIGHATLLVQFDGITILTDPAFSTYCGPSLSQQVGLGYKRFREAACQVKDIAEVAEVDVVIVSHDHFDHFDGQSAKDISKHFPNAKWFIGLQGGDLITGKKENISEMNWWEEKTIMVKEKHFTFVCTPAQHWCRRSAFDLNKRLWCSWVVKGPTKNFFFAGDTGYYQPVFEKIGEKYGPFSVSAIPIGCYKPIKVLEYQHVGPDKAVQIHKDVKSEQSIAMHWGAFAMANEFYLEPPQKLEECMGEERDKFISLQHGETWVVGSPRDRPKFMDYKRTAQNQMQVTAGTSVDDGVKGVKQNYEEIQGEQFSKAHSGTEANNRLKAVKQNNEKIWEG